MKILQVCAAYKPAFVYGGPTMSVSMLSEQLTKAGVYNKVYTTTANGKNELPVNPGKLVTVDGVDVIYFKRITKDHSHFSPALLKSLWSEVSQFDLVHIHAWWNLVSVCSCLVALIKNVPVIVSARGTLSEYSFQNRNIGPKWLLHHLLGKRLLNRCHIHATSKREKTAIMGLIRPKSLVILPNFVKLSLNRRFEKKSTAATFKLLFFSRIEEKKGLDLLLNALPALQFPFHLTIAGDGNSNYIAQLKAIASDKELTDKISWVGFFNENKFELLRDHDLFVLPSYDENFGNTVIESLSVGTAVLISEQVGLADYVSKNNLGWICQTDPVSVSKEINNIIEHNAAGLSRIGTVAPGIIKRDFNEENLVRKYINMYLQTD